MVTFLLNYLKYLVVLSKVTAYLMIMLELMCNCHTILSHLINTVTSLRVLLTQYMKTVVLITLKVKMAKEKLVSSQINKNWKPGSKATFVSVTENRLKNMSLSILRK